MENVVRYLCFFCLLLLLSPFLSSSFPLCTNLRQPSSKPGKLSFCPYYGKVCCSQVDDQQLKKQFEAMNISDSSCASAVKSILCANCDPFSAKLFDSESEPRSVPILCNSSASTQKNVSFCSSVWDSCQDVPILNSPFAPELQTKAAVPQNGTLSKLTDLWQSESDFCTAFGGERETSPCFNGEPVSLNKTDTIPPPKGICIEKIGNSSYINMVAHPDGSKRAFFNNVPGKVWLATIPEQDSGEVLGVDESSPFLDLTDVVYQDSTLGMYGMAFHPDFVKNGRFFASFNCDKEKSPGCNGRCACNSVVDCDPSQVGSLESADQVCKYFSIVAEYSANGTGSTPSMAEHASPQEVQRVFTMGLPFTGNHGGQILFGPADGYMYFMMGDGGSKGDPYNFAQNKKSLLGKIMRIDVDNFPSQDEIDKLDLWGNYSIPGDNPYSEDRDMHPEIWAYGFRNPWRCSFDPERPSYFLCADIGQDQYEEVDIISKGGNYGWRVYEGPLVFEPQKTPGGNTSADSIDPILPVLGYTHSEINKLGSAAIAGGLFYRSQTDPCIYGSYLYGDIYGSHIWAASETPTNSGNFTSSDTPFSCAPDSPIKCDLVPNSNLPALGLLYSFGQDNSKDVYILTQSGLYRVVRPSRCNYACSKEVVAPGNPPATAPSSRACLVLPTSLIMFLASVLVMFL